jgi:hypothetical protein
VAEFICYKLKAKVKNIHAKKMADETKSVIFPEK